MNTPVEPQVSVIMPVYNAGKVLNYALDSALKQTLQSVEVVAVDDGSSDDSFRILSERAAADERLRVFRQPSNLGTLAARNRGIRECRGKYVMFLDPDDFLDPKAAEELSQLAERENADVIHFGTREFTRTGDGVCKPRYNWIAPDEKRISGPRAVLEDLLLGGHNWSLCFKLFRRETCMKALNEMEDFFCVMGEDLYFYLAAAFYAETLVQTGRKYYNYDTTAGITADQIIPPEKFRGTATLLDAMSRCRNFLLLKGILEDPVLGGGWEKIERGQYLILWNRWYSRLAPGTRGEVGEYLLRHAGNPELLLLALFDENDYLRKNEEFLKFARGIYRTMNFFLPENSFLRMKLKAWYKKRKAVRKDRNLCVSL